jgi:hypothetical protein
MSRRRISFADAVAGGGEYRSGASGGRTGEAGDCRRRRMVFAEFVPVRVDFSDFYQSDWLLFVGIELKMNLNSGWICIRFSIECKSI